MQVGLLEGESQDRKDRVGAVPLVPALLLADQDAKLAVAIDPVDVVQSDVTDVNAIRSLNRGLARADRPSPPPFRANVFRSPKRSARAS